MIDLQTRKRRAHDALLAAALIAATVMFYTPALHGGFLWDDDAYISHNATLRTLAGLRAIWLDPSATCQYYPLSFTFFWAVYQLCGLDPLGFHLLTVLLHGLAAVLFWQVLARLRVRGALLAGAIFALHPVNVMSAAWMTELKNTLSASLALGAAWAYIRFAGLGVYDGGRNGRNGEGRWYLMALALFLLAMLAKTAVSFLPVTLFLIVWWQRETVTRRDLLALTPMLGIAVGMGAFTIYIERHAGGASGKEFTVGLLDRVLISGRSFWFYLGKLVWPCQLTFIYERWKVDPGDWAQWLYPVAAFTALTGAWLARRRIGKGVFVALMHFYISTSMLVLAVVLFMMRYSFVSDHWQYFGSMGIIALAASLMTRALDGAGRWQRPLRLGLGVALILGLGALTWAQCGMYSDAETLWTAAIARNPDCWMARNNLGLISLRQGRADEAIAQFREALRIDPEIAEIHASLGTALFQRGQREEGLVELRDAVRINPDYAVARVNVGNALLEEGLVDAAVAQYREAVRISPGYAEANNNLGLALFHLGRTGEAIAQYREAVRINPAYAEAHYNLGNALIQQGEAGDAIEHTEEALKLQPDNPAIQNNLAWMLAAAPQTSLRNGARAVQLAREASQSGGGGNPTILHTLAAAYAEAGDFPDAVQTARKALQLAEVQSNTSLPAALRREIKLYEAGHAYEAPRQ